MGLPWVEQPLQAPPRFARQGGGDGTHIPQRRAIALEDVTFVGFERGQHGGMDDRLQARFMTRRSGIVGGEKEVLAIPGFDVFVVPDLWTEFVAADKAVGVEARLPVGGPLAVDVVLALLAGAGGREDHQRGMGGETADQGVGGRGREMFGDFQAEGDVKTPPQGPGLGEVAVVKVGGGSQKVGGREGDPVQAAKHGDAQVLGRAQPGAATTADIQEAGGVMRGEQAG